MRACVCTDVCTCVSLSVCGAFMDLCLRGMGAVCRVGISGTFTEPEVIDTLGSEILIVLFCLVSLTEFWGDGGAETGT